MDTRTQTRKPVKARGPRRRPVRTAHLDTCPFDDFALLILTIDGIPTQYGMRPLAADEGQAFRLNKPDGTVYDVFLAGPHSTCECPGFLRWNHCKHLESLLALIAEGKLEGQS